MPSQYLRLAHSASVHVDEISKFAKDSEFAYFKPTEYTKMTNQLRSTEGVEYLSGTSMKWKVQPSQNWLDVVCIRVPKRNLREKQ